MRTAGRGQAVRVPLYTADIQTRMYVKYAHSRTNAIDRQVRRTKDESEKTRQQILTAARAEFARRGVTRTTLEHIARTAGVTRGAIYWHFANKAELFNAMREQVTLPLVDRTDFALLEPPDGDPLTGIERFMHSVAEAVLQDKDTRKTFEILSLKCEYVDELRHELTRQGRQCSELLQTLTRRYRDAAAAGTLRADIDPDLAGMESCAFVIGVVRMSLLCGGRSPMASRVRDLIAMHVHTRRAVRNSRTVARRPSFR